MKCPRCDGIEFREVDCGPDGWDDDITYTSEVCENCGLWHDGWVDKWLLDVDNWNESEGAEEWKKENEKVTGDE